MNPAPPVRVGRASLRSVAARSHPHGRHRNPRRPYGTPTHRAEAMPRPTCTDPQETRMTTTDWRDFDDRDAHQDRLATELATETGTDW